MANINAAIVALADPTRRQIFERVAARSGSVGVIAKGLPVSRPAVSQHLKVLKEAGLVEDRADGTKRIYSIDPHGLGPLRAWLDQFWDEALASYASQFENSEDEGETS